MALWLNLIFLHLGDEKKSAILKDGRGQKKEMGLITEKQSHCCCSWDERWISILDLRQPRPLMEPSPVLIFIIYQRGRAFTHLLPHICFYSRVSRTSTYTCSSLWILLSRQRKNADIIFESLLLFMLSALFIKALLFLLLWKR